MAIDQSGGLEKDAKALKDRVKKARTAHDLHVGLLMHQQGLSKADAIILAYLDGALGLNDRLQPREPMLAFDPEVVPMHGAPGIIKAKS